MPIEIRTVAVIGLGTLGSQIALLAASRGYQVVGFDPMDDAINKYLQRLPRPESQDQAAGIFDTSGWFSSAHKIKLVDSAAEAASCADLVIEAVPENLGLKRKVWAELDRAAPAHALLATNSSSIPVSRLEDASKRPEKCLNMHFYHPVLGQNMADLMGGQQTTPQVFQAGYDFIASLGVVPLRVNKELLGFCYNRVWRAIKKETLYMWANGFVDYRDVDRGWMILNHAPRGPFGLMDTVGLDVIYDIEMFYYNDSGDPKDHPPQALKDMVDAGKLGVKSGKGFYSYPDPEFARPDFLVP